MDLEVPFGGWPILMTPFTPAGAVDWPALEEVMDFYIARKTPGLLALGQASEVLDLSDEERYEIARRVAARCAGKIFSVAVGNYGTTLEEQAAALLRIRQLGIDVPVVGLSLLPSGEQLEVQLLRLAELAGVPLGLYELPDPVHRLLTPAQVAVLAQSGRYVFMKDTCRDLPAFTAKVAAARGSPLKIFQANLQILLESLQAGCHGFCGHMAMVAPELMAQVCDPATPAGVRQAGFEQLLEFQNAMRAEGFPAAAKYTLSRRGVRLGSACRVKMPHAFTAANEQALDALLARRDWFSQIT